MNEIIATLEGASRLHGTINKFFRLMVKAGATLEHIKMLIGSRAKRNNLVAYLEAGCPRLTSEMLGRIYTFLRHSGQVTIQALTDKHDPQAFFQARSGLYVWDGFKNLVLKFAKPVSDVPAVTLDRFELERKASDHEIIKDLGDGAIFRDASLFCAYLAYLIKQQPNGEKGVLLNDGKANLFIVEVNGQTVVVNVRWSSGRREWDVGAHPPDDCHWHAGDQVLAPATAT